MTRFCDVMECSRDYGFRLDDEGNSWCNTCGYIEYLWEDVAYDKDDPSSVDDLIDRME